MAAKQIAKETGDELINISDCIKNGKYSFTTKRGEKVGFVFPVYYYTIPSMVKKFTYHIVNIKHAYHNTHY